MKLSVAIGASFFASLSSSPASFVNGATSLLEKEDEKVLNLSVDAEGDQRIGITTEQDKEKITDASNRVDVGQQEVKKSVSNIKYPRRLQERKIQQTNKGKGSNKCDLTVPFACCHPLLLTFEDESEFFAIEGSNERSVFSDVTDCQVIVALNELTTSLNTATEIQPLEIDDLLIALAVSGPWMSLAVRFLAFRDNYIHQARLIEALEGFNTEFEKIINEVILNEFSASSKVSDPLFSEMTNSLTSIGLAYKEFLESRIPTVLPPPPIGKGKGKNGQRSLYENQVMNEPERNLKRNKRRDRRNFLDGQQKQNMFYVSNFRNVCNVPSKRPQDIFRRFYSYGCAPNDLGKCLFDESPRDASYSFLADEELSSEDVETSEAALVDLRRNRNWLLNVLVEAMILHFLCLPSMPEDLHMDDSVDQLYSDKTQDMISAIREVSANLNEKIEDVETHIDEITDAPELPDSGGIEICRRPKDVLVAIQPSDPKYYDTSYSEPVISSITRETVDNSLRSTGQDINSVVSTLTKVTGNVATIASAVDWKQLATALNTFGPAMAAVSSVVSLVFSFTKGPDPIETLINDKFDELFDKLDDLEEYIGREFIEIKEQIADQTLDEFVSALQAISASYTDLELAGGRDRDRSEEARSTPNVVVRNYVEKFRADCNVPHRRPMDIFRDLYGYACGDIGDGYQCGSSNWGACKFGSKKRQFLLDIFRDTANNDFEKFQVFATWLRSAMIQASLYYNFCPSSLEATCIDPAEDPVARQTRIDIEEAFTEVNDNLQRVLQCFQDNPTDLLTMEFLTGRVDTRPCANVNEGGGARNACIAEAIRDVLIENDTFEKFEWLVVVYDKDDCVRVDGDEGGASAGYHRVAGSGEDGIMNKKFHFMYHSKGFDAEKKTVFTQQQFSDCFRAGLVTGDVLSTCLNDFLKDELGTGFGYIGFTNCDGNNRGTTRTNGFLGDSYFGGTLLAGTQFAQSWDWIY